MVPAAAVPVMACGHDDRISGTRAMDCGHRVADVAARRALCARWRTVRQIPLDFSTALALAAEKWRGRCRSCYASAENTDGGGHAGDAGTVSVPNSRAQLEMAIAKRGAVSDAVRWRPVALLSLVALTMAPARC